MKQPRNSSLRTKRSKSFFRNPFAIPTILVLCLLLAINWQIYSMTIFEMAMLFPSSNNGMFGWRHHRNSLQQTPVLHSPEQIRAILAAKRAIKEQPMQSTVQASRRQHLLQAPKNQPSQRIQTVEAEIQPKKEKKEKPFLQQQAEKPPKHSTQRKAPIQAKTVDKPDSANEQPIFDILSIGSNSRKQYLDAQRRTFGTHPQVRHFVGVTEEDDSDRECHTLTRGDAEHIAKFCRLPPKLPFGDRNKTYAFYPPLQERSMLSWHRRDFADWNKFLEPKPNPAGWLCAQKRANDGLYKLVQETYLKNVDVNDRQARASALPDFLFIIDDDTFLNIQGISDYLSTPVAEGGVPYPSSQPLVMAGCLIKYPGHVRFAWGGWGTIVSRASLLSMTEPIDCSHSSQDPFQRNACRRLQQNLLDEQQYYRDGITITQWMNAYVTTNSYAAHANWTEATTAFTYISTADAQKQRHNNLLQYPAKDGAENSRMFCVHSDWVWGYFFNYYNIGGHAGSPIDTDVAAPMGEPRKNRAKQWETELDPVDAPQARYVSYRSSYELAYKADPEHKWSMRGQCSLQKNSCALDSLEVGQVDICHYVSDVQMRRMHKTLQQRQQGASAQKIEQTQSKVWKSLWTNTKTGNQPAITDTVTSLPVWPKLQSDPAIPVFVFPSSPSSFVSDGVMHSHKLKPTDGLLAPVWIVDGGDLAANATCLELVELIKQRRGLVAQQHGFYDAKRDPWRIAILHWEGEGYTNDFSDCMQATRLFDTTRIVHFKRSRVVRRQYYPSKGFVMSGHVLSFGNWRDHARAPVQPLSLGLSTEFATLFTQSAAVSARRKLGQRSMDVAHFGTPMQNGTRLRDRVSNALQKQLSHKQLHIGVIKDNEAYAAKLLDSKIVVIAQHDQWEEADGLLEAMASGAMVLIDPMLTPPVGLEDGVSCIYYHSLEDLIQKVEYYLQNDDKREAIAKNGQIMALQHHQSWNTMERVVQTLLES